MLCPLTLLPLPLPHIFRPYMSFSFFALSFLGISLPSLYSLWQYVLVYPGHHPALLYEWPYANTCTCEFVDSHRDTHMRDRWGVHRHASGCAHLSTMCTRIHVSVYTLTVRSHVYPPYTPHPG